MQCWSGAHSQRRLILITREDYTASTAMVEKNGVLDAVQDYSRRGWSPTPVQPRSKKPILNDWPNRRLSEDDLAVHFSDPARNIGLVLGDASGGIVDIDLDCPECVKLAPHFPP